MNKIPAHIYKKFTENARESIATAESLATKYANEFHLLIGLFHQEGSLASNIFYSHNIKLRKQGLKKFKPSKKSHSPKWNRNFENAIKAAVKKASLLELHYIGTEHLLYGALTVIQNGSKKIPRKYQKLLEPGLTKEAQKEIITHLNEIFQNSISIDELDSTVNQFSLAPANKQQKLISLLSPRQKKRSQRVLSKFAHNLTQAAEDGKLDPIIGRKQELNRLMRILSRRQKNNPLLVSEAGVGKTALVHGLAQNIAEGRVPPRLLDKQILSLDLSLIVAGTSYRGDFERRLKRVLKEAENKNVILFIDEIHNIAGAGSASGSLDAANILKEPLTRGEVQIIGATTHSEFRKHLSNDRALERRFQPLSLRELTPEATREILEENKSIFEKHFQIFIPPSLLPEIVYLTQKYIPERNLPDKALDLLDEACSEATIRKKDIRKMTKYKSLTKKLEKTGTHKFKALQEDAFEEALHQRKKEQRLATKIRELETHRDTKDHHTLRRTHLRKTISEMTNIPLRKIKRNEKEKLLHLEKRISNKIIGQEQAITAVCKTLQRSRVRLSEEERPLGSFIFLGPPGVGKTELAKVIAEQFFPHQESFTRLDMSEFSEKHTVSRLLGAPAGYVGYGEGGQLTEKVRNHPFHLILFDEIEKAHSQVYNLLLQILEEGSLTDSQGRQVDFKNTIIIMTSNIGSKEFTNAHKQIGFELGSQGNKNKIKEKFSNIRKKVSTQLEQSLRPELISRIDSIMVFNPLGKKELREIIQLEIETLKQKLDQHQNIKLRITSSALNHLTKKSYDPSQGARKIRKIIKNKLETPIVQKIIGEEINPPASVKVRKRGGRITFDT